MKLRYPDDFPVHRLSLLPVRASNILKINFTVAGQVRAATDSEILRLPNCGLKSLREIRFCLDDRDFEEWEKLRLEGWLKEKWGQHYSLAPLPWFEFAA